MSTLPETHLSRPISPMSMAASGLRFSVISSSIPDMVNWGILSTARINRRLIPAIRSVAESKLSAVASRSPEKATAYAESWEIETPYGSYEDLLADPDIDVVYISLPNDLHSEWTIKALDAGKHVLCEKPLCTTIEEFEAVEEAVIRSGRRVAEAFMYLHHPQTAYFKSLIDEGRIGDLRTMQSSFSYMWSREEDNYRLTNPVGGGSLWDIGVYPVSFFRYICGAPPIACKGIAFPGEPDMRFSATLEYQGGVSANFYCAFDTHFSTETVIHGTLGRLRITHPFNYMEKCKAWIETDDNSTELELPKANLYQLEVEDMNNVALNNANPLIALSRSRDVLQTVLDLRADAGLGS